MSKNNCRNLVLRLLGEELKQNLTKSPLKTLYSRKCELDNGHIAVLQADSPGVMIIP